MSKVKKCVFIILFFAQLNGHADSTLSDPMRPSGSLSTTTSDEKSLVNSGWQLTSTLISDQRKVASVNNQIVEEGDTVMGAKVLNITNGQIKLNYRGEVMIVKLLSQTIRK